MGDEQWKETSHGLAAKAWECADTATKAAEKSADGSWAMFAMQQAQFLMLMAILKAIDEIGVSNG